MGIRKKAAEAVSTVSTAALQHIFHRPAGNFPGKMALYIDPSILSEMAGKLRRGSVCVVGTNGKTTVTNMLADCLVAAGQQVVCNRTGANLDSGVATSLLHAHPSDWGIFECDELWLAKILPHLQSRYVLLLNLFHDQLDRVGEVENIQNSIIDALQRSPRTTLVYNADDPYCETIAQAVSNKIIPFGIDEALPQPPGMAGNAFMCQHCESMLDYAYYSYSQLGSYTCPQCGFTHPNMKFMLRNCHISTQGMAFDVLAATDENAVAGGTIAHIEAPYTGAYMLYNLLAVYTAGHVMGLSNNVIQLSIKAFDQHNGRLEYMNVQGRKVLMNLAKNPTGFNQNLSLVLQNDGPAAVGFFVNDQEGDGRDVSWLWDVSFEALAQRPNTVVFAGGERANDLQVRLKYADAPAIVVESATQLMQYTASLPAEYQVYLIANYTSLPVVRAECVALAEAQEAPAALPIQAPALPQEQSTEGEPLRIAHLFPDLLDQGGDRGNVTVLEKRCAWRGIPVEVEQVFAGSTPQFEHADIVVLGDGFDRQQRLACKLLLPSKDALAAYVQEGGVLLAIDGGLQILGSTWYIGSEEIPGLGVLGISNGHEEADVRHVGNIAVKTQLATMPVVGFENHAGTTLLEEGMPTFGEVLYGIGNNAGDKTEGVHSNNLIGTYVHGPLLAKNPEIADWLITQALARKVQAAQLQPLDDSIEKEANAFICKRLKV